MIITSPRFNVGERVQVRFDSKWIEGKVLESMYTKRDGWVKFRWSHEVLLDDGWVLTSRESVIRKAEQRRRKA